MDGFLYEPLFSPERQMGTLPVSVRVCIHVYEYGTGSLGAADVSKDTDVVEEYDVTRHGRGHSSSFTSSRGVMVWQINAG